MGVCIYNKCVIFQPSIRINFLFFKIQYAKNEMLDKYFFFLQKVLLLDLFLFSPLCTMKRKKVRVLDCATQQVSSDFFLFIKVNQTHSNKYIYTSFSHFSWTLQASNGSSSCRHYIPVVPLSVCLVLLYFAFKTIFRTFYVVTWQQLMAYQ